MATYDRIAGLPLRVEGYGLEPLARAMALFTRRTTVIHLHGGGHTGLGEDVVYGEEDQLHQAQVGPVLDLTGDWTLDSFSAHLAQLDLFHGRPPGYEGSDRYRIWAFESAALDLALRQAGEPLHAVLGIPARPLDFVVSLRLGVPPSREPLARRPASRFKLDYDPSWDDDFLAHLAADGRTDVVDFKGAYRGTPVDVETVPDLYRRIAEALPHAWLEDPDLTVPEARAALEPFADRVTWDAPFHEAEDIDGFPWRPRALNVKPSRIGSLRTLLGVYDACAERGIRLYGGGQSELGVGRGQIQLLAALFHPDSPNDVAPRGWDWDDPPPGLPGTPLDPAPAPVGFRRAE